MGTYAGVVPSEWIDCAYLEVTEKCAQHIWDEHNMLASDVKFAVEGVGNLPCRWHEHPEWGWRVIVVTEFKDQAILIAMFPTDDGSAYPI